MGEKISAASRKRIKRKTVTEYRCVYCGKWVESAKPRLTCGPSHRVLLHRMRERGERPKYAQ